MDYGFNAFPVLDIVVHTTSAVTRQAPSGRLGRLSVREEVSCAFRAFIYGWLYDAETIGRKGQSWVVFGVIKWRKSCQFFLCWGGGR